MFSKSILKVIAVVIAVVVLFTSTISASTSGMYGVDAQAEVTSEEIIQPDAESELQPGIELSAKELEALESKLTAVREKYDAQVDNFVGATSDGLADVFVAPTGRQAWPKLDSEAYLPLPNTVYALNQLNTRANTVGSTLAEPAAANEGPYIFATGNTHAEYSLNRGSTWTAVAIPAGPADAPFTCCDLDVVYDRSRGLTIWSALQTNSAVTNGVIRLFVRRTVDTANACSYTIDPGGAGTLLPDYPHLGLSDNWLYLSTNNLPGSSQVRRFNLNNMGDCVGAATETYTYNGALGQRVFVPVEGATDTMYWGALVNNASFRVYKWPETPGAAVVTVDRAITASNFVNPDCRGGVGNFDFIERSTAWSITGFRMRGAVGKQGLLFLWNVGPDAAHTQGHVHAALFRESDLALLGQPHIYNNTFCFGFPSVAVNDRGDYGLTIAGGGKLGGGGSAAQGYIAIDDSFTPGVGYFQTVYTTASGTHNRSDSRFGDYFTIHRQTPCGLYFAATNYALLNGTATANVNSRYVEFGRGRDYKCWAGWSWRTRLP